MNVEEAELCFFFLFSPQCHWGWDVMKEGGLYVLSFNFGTL